MANRIESGRAGSANGWIAAALVVVVAVMTLAVWARLSTGVPTEAASQASGAPPKPVAG